MKLQPGFRCSSLSTLDTGSGRYISAKYYDTDVWHTMVPAYGMVCLPQNSSTGNGKIPGCSIHSYRGSTLTIRLQLNTDFDRGFPRSKSLILTDMHMYKRFGARRSSIEIGVELQSYR